MSLTPQQIVRELDKYIVGQHDAKRNVAIALRNRWRRMQAKGAIKNEIIPNNILLIGATGVGKTEIARRMARIADAPFIKVEASKFTEVGYVGRDVESMVRDLAEQSVSLVKAQKREVVKEKAAKIVEDIILNALVFPQHFASDATEEKLAAELNYQKRTSLHKKIQTGELDEQYIEIDIKPPQMPGISMVGAGMMDDSTMMNLQEMLSGMMPQKNKKRKVTVAEARRILLEEEAGKLIDMDEVKEEAIRRAEEAGIIFIDEIDKIASSGSKDGADVSREGVQRDLLPIVEGSAVSTKYGIIKTDHILFVAAGAFHVSKPSDLIPELQGRFPIRVELENLTQKDFVRILNEPQNALIKQYQALFDTEGVSIQFEEEAVQQIAETAFQINAEVENIGARRLHTVMSKLLNEYLYDVPDNFTSETITVTAAMVKERLDGLIKNKNLSEYIL